MAEVEAGALFDFTVGSLVADQTNVVVGCAVFVGTSFGLSDEHGSNLRGRGRPVESISK